jgi:fatty acid desaturase
MVMTGLLQHGGLAEDVLDHRLNSRTVYMNPISRWIYWNMNYHVEHHMFPMVPYHALPKLHALIKNDLPTANPSIVDGYREMIDSLKRQRVEPNYYVRKELPPTAKPYREELHDEDSIPQISVA